MNESKVPTKFAPAERSSLKQLEHQVVLFRDNEILNTFLEKIPATFLIVNENRQIVYMNKGAIEFTGVDDITAVIGKRPGEVIGCIHSSEEIGGCGTTESCTYCGAVNAVLESQKGKTVVKDATLILEDRNVALDLRIWAAPLIVNDIKFTALTIQDIHDEKRREYMERVFFHDMLNIITALYGTIQLLTINNEKNENKELIEQAERTIKRLIDEIRSQEILSSAEHGSVTIIEEQFDSLGFLKVIVESFVNDKSAVGKSLKISPASVSARIESDQNLLRRILGNMMKNALEATSKGETITIGSSKKGNHLCIWVNNPEFIPKDIQLRIFKRNFSTKGEGRGLGTYSMKLLSSFINGDVNFISSKDKGTTFYIKIPLERKLSGGFDT
jgi:signal transduction histidine kinase